MATKSLLTPGQTVYTLNMVLINIPSVLNNDNLLYEE